ncbi:MAG: NAD(P)/FAD-dependent oxidoreductase [Kiloniellaceae bacterium]
MRERPNDAVLHRWRKAVQGERALGVIEIGRFAKVDAAPLTAFSGIEFFRVADDHGCPEMEALLLAESSAVHYLTNGKPAAEAVRRGPAGTRPGQRVAMVGGGIINLITAFELARSGYAVTLFDVAPDPRAGAGWRSYGCTFGGCDARIFSFNEGRHHHFKGYDIGQGTNTQFHRPIAEGGWLAADPATLGPEDEDWIDCFSQVPPWLAARFDQNIVSFNMESWPLWRCYLEAYPALFSEVGFQDRLLRLYATPEKYAHAQQSEAALESVLRDIDAAALAGEFPSLAAAVAGGHVAGALEVQGFSINVHKLGCRLISEAEKLGVVFHHDCAVTGVVRDADGAVAGVRCGTAVISSDHYVVSTGAYSNDLLRAFGSEGRVAPMIGMWLTLADEPPYLDLPLKISRAGYASQGAAEGANVIAGRDDQGRRVVYISSGHGYIGIDNRDPSLAMLADLGRAVEETAAQYFPAQFRRAEAAGELAQRTKYCIRPWTPHGLGLFEMLPASGGGAVVLTGGHNTGGFAQSPSVAKAVRLALQGESHPMHRLYHPSRFTHFLRSAAVQREALP